MTLSRLRRKPRRKPENLASPVTASVTAALRKLALNFPEIHPEIWSRWQDIAGPQMYRRTFPLKLQQGILTVGVSSSTWLQQLSFLKESLLNRLDEEVGPDVVSEIRFVLDSSVAARGPRVKKPRTAAKNKSAPAAIDPSTETAIEKIDAPELAEAIRRAMLASIQRGE